MLFNARQFMQSKPPIPAECRDNCECQAKNQGVYKGVNNPRKCRSSLGPDSAEHPLKPWYKTQNRAKRFNKLDNQNCFGTRGSEVQILSPRPILLIPVNYGGPADHLMFPSQM
jgi:hypothetical protein